MDWKLEKVYDTFVKPDRPVVDYNTRFSGVTAENLQGVTTTMREVQAVLLSMILKSTILVGHSLESDLRALKVSAGHSQLSVFITFQRESKYCLENDLRALTVSSGHSQLFSVYNFSARKQIAWIVT